MNEPSSSGKQSLGPSGHRRIDLACDRFESAWKAGQRPHLEDYLKETSGSERPALLLELLVIELLYRNRKKERLTSEEFRQRFPQDLDTVQRAFQAVAGRRVRDSLKSREASGSQQAAEAPVDSQETGPDLSKQKSPTAPLPSTARKLPNIPGFRIVRVLGRGGMGIVYEAVQLALKRRVALKMIVAGDQAKAEDLERFRLEAEAVARLQHPNIVQIYEIGQYKGYPFFSLELVEGCSLAQKINGKQLPAREAAKLVRTLARAIHAAHERQIIHRDLKPANVLLTTDGTPKITDFGLAKRLDADSRHTRTGVIMGTPSYMAPEQAAGNTRSIGPTTDVYALGAILYETLTGKPPFQAATPLDTVLQVLDREPDRPRQLRPKLARDLETICLRCLEKDQRRRYPTAEALADDLEALLEGRPIRSRPVTTMERCWRWCRRNPALSGLSAAAAILILFAGVMACISYFREKDLERLTSVNEKQKEKVTEQQLQIKKEQGNVRQQEQVARSAADARRAKEYLHDIKRIPKAWQDVDFRLAQQLLEAYRPEPGQFDHRRWEWYYLKSLVAEAMSIAEVGQLSPSQTVIKVYWSPDDQFLACVFYVSAGTSQGIKVWNISKAQEIFSEEASSGYIGELMWSADGKRFAATRGSAVSIYDVPGKRKLRTLFEGKDFGSNNNLISRNNRISWSADGKQLAAVAPDQKSAVVYEVDSGREIFVLKNQSGEARLLQWSPDGQTIVVGEADAGVRAFDGQTGREAFALPSPGPGMVIHAAVWKPDCRELACLYRSAGNAELDAFVVKVWGIANRQARLNLLGYDPNASSLSVLAWSKDGQRLSLASDDVMNMYAPIPKLWEAATGEKVPLKVLPERMPSRQVLLDPFARRYTDSPLQIRMIDSGGVVSAVKGLPTAYGLPARSVLPLAWNSQGDRLALRGGSYSTREGEGVKLLVWSLSPETPPKKSWMLPEVDSFAWSRDNSHFGAAKEKPFSAGTNYQAMDLQIGTVDQQRLLTIKPTDRTTLGFPPLKPEVPPGIRYFAWSPDEQRLATMSTDRTFTLWNPGTGEPLHSWTQQKETIPSWGCLAWSPDSRRIATTMREIISAPGSRGLPGTETIREIISVRDAATGKELFSMTPKLPTQKLPGGFLRQPPSFLCLAWSPDGSRLASIMDDPLNRGFQISIWDTVTGQECRSILDDSEQPSNQSYSCLLAWRADGKHLATCIRWGKGIRIWDTESGRAVQTLNTPANSEPEDLFWNEPERLVLRSKDVIGDAHRNHQIYLNVWDTEVWDEVLTLKGPEAAFHMSPDKRWVFNGLAIKELPPDK